MHQFPYHDAWDDEDAAADAADQYEHALQRKRARTRWLVAALAGIAVVTVTSGMILVGAGPRLAASLDRWETELWEPTLAETRRATSAAPAPVPPPPAEPAPLAAPPAETAAAPPAPPAPTAVPEPTPAAAPPPVATTAPAQPQPQAKAPARKADAPRGAAPRAGSTRSKAPAKGTAEPDRDLIYGGGVSWRKGAALPSAEASSQPAPSEQPPQTGTAPAAPTSAPSGGVYDQR